MSDSKPFIPKDKPKSWVILIISGLFGVLFGGPLALLGKTFEIEIIFSAGLFVLSLCWLCGFIFGIVFMFGLIDGKYESINERDWGDQVW